MPASSDHPVIILVQPQLGENIGMCARAMLNCGLERMRLVNPRDGWPNEKAVAASADAEAVISGAEVFDSVADAVADCSRVYATTARKRALQLPVDDATEAAQKIHSEVGTTAILFGPEASGLDNDAVSHADRILNFPINPGFSSLNLAQAVLLLGWEWWRCRDEHFENIREEPAVPREALAAFLDRLESALGEGDFFKTPEMRPHTMRNMRTLFNRARPTEQELNTLHGVLKALKK
ncbi:MAG: RNA methyltransferase [Verrucomicrobiales bacterium]